MEETNHMHTIPARRLHNQGLDGPRFATADEVVAWFGAVQAQEYALAKWALGLRMPGATDAVIEQAATDGALERLGKASTRACRACRTRPPTWACAAAPHPRPVDGGSAGPARGVPGP
jgi:hypothetical protein